MSAPTFSPELFTFLRQLKRHNDRVWFARHKPHYEQFGIAAALNFIHAFATPLERLSPHFVADDRPTRGSLFRIYRDTRFSPDKTPYKTHLGIRFAHEAATNIHAPIFYLHLEPSASLVAAGVWHPDPRSLTRLRSAIVAEPERWQKSIRGLTLDGESLRRPPRGFPTDHPLIEDLKRKDFTAIVELSDEAVCAPTFFADFTRICQTLSPLVSFTSHALGLPF